MGDLKPTLHTDGTVTYWSTYEQRWVNHARGVPDREYAAMGGAERRMVQSHLDGVAFLATHQSDESHILDHGFTIGLVIAQADTMAGLAALVVHSQQRGAFDDGGDGCVLVDTGERFRRMTDDEHEDWSNALRDAW